MIRRQRFPLRGLGDTAPDYSPSWFDVVGTMRQIGPALTAAQVNLTTAMQAAANADFAADPDGFSTTNVDQVYPLYQQVANTIDQFNSLASALNTASGLFPGGSIGLASLRGILPDTIGGWTLAAVLGLFGPIPAMLAAVSSLFASMTGASAPGGGIVNSVAASISNTNAAVNQALNTLAQTPGQVGQAAANAATQVGKYLVIGLVVFLLGDAVIHKEGLL